MTVAPHEVVFIKRNKLYISKFGFSNEKIFVSCPNPPKVNNNIILVSSLLVISAIDSASGEQKKRMIITFYNFIQKWHD